jgi:hypothetical protein
LPKEVIEIEIEIKNPMSAKTMIAGHYVPENQGVRGTQGYSRRLG